MEEKRPGNEGRIGVRPGVSLQARSFPVAPGDSVAVPVLLINRGLVPDRFQLSVVGIPSAWVSVPSPIVSLSAGEEREILLVIQPPDEPHGVIGRHPVVIQVASLASPGLVSAAEFQLSVAAVQVEGRLGILLGASEFSVVPGDSLSVPIVLVNQGLDPDSFRLALEGLPSMWVSAESPVTHLAPGQQREVSLTIRPPHSAQSRAGRHPFKLRVSSEAYPDQVAEAECTLSVAAFGQFRSELRPPQVEPGQPARVTVDNQGNVQQVFTVTWRSPDDELLFEPGPTQELRVPPGQVGLLEFRASPRRRPLLGGEKAYPFTTRVESAEREAQNLNGDVVGRGLLPSWLLPAVLVLVLVTACVAALLVLGVGDREGRPTETAVAQVTATVEAPPTEAPLPTEAPPPTEAPAPTEEPPVVPTAEPPLEPTQEPPVEPTEESPPGATDEPGGGPGPELPCLPAAAPLLVFPLLAKRSRRQDT